jgi:hypothetical protein
MGACRRLRERAIVLAIVIIVAVVAALAVYVVHKVNPKRVKVRAGVLKILTFDFEADGGSQSGEPDAGLGRGTDLKELPPTSTDGQ